MLLFTQSRQVGFALQQNWSKIKKKKYIDLRDHQNSALDTGLPVKIFFDCR